MVKSFSPVFWFILQLFLLLIALNYSENREKKFLLYSLYKTWKVNSFKFSFDLSNVQQGNIAKRKKTFRLRL